MTVCNLKSESKYSQSNLRVGTNCFIKIGNSNAFISYVALNYFAANRNKMLSIATEKTQDNTYMWNDMIDLVDIDKNKGIDHWISMFQVWGADISIAEFLGTFVYNSIHQKQEQEGKQDKVKVSTQVVVTPPIYLTSKDKEAITSFATVMAYTYGGHKDLYAAVKKGLTDYLLKV